MESDNPECHHVISRHPKSREDEDPPDPDDHNDPDDLPNIATFIFTQPRIGAQALPDSILNPTAIQVVPNIPGRLQPIHNEDKRTEETATGKSNIKMN